ncbi:hypothetical protein VPH35_054056 [Triticum aestivum]|uniref:Uncharacterized protein n=1 Tax=Triticum turgidum subsp. durum TaxID=4567 RepID=A0A9R1S5Q5_TRITD|nr:unnamed protein product [Triticum turgidum subsp. durum]
MMYPMAWANDIFPVMVDDMGFVLNGYAGITMVPPAPPPQGGVGIVSLGSSNGRSAMTQVDMMTCMCDRAIMDNDDVRKRGTQEDPSCKRSIDCRHCRMIKNRELAA